MFAIKKIKDYAGNLLIIICGNLCIANMLIQDTKLVVVHKAFRLRSFGHRSRSLQYGEPCCRRVEEGHGCSEGKVCLACCWSLTDDISWIRSIFDFCLANEKNTIAATILGKIDNL